MAAITQLSGWFLHYFGTHFDRLRTSIEGGVRLHCSFCSVYITKSPEGNDCNLDKLKQIYNSNNSSLQLLVLLLKVESSIMATATRQPLCAVWSFCCDWLFGLVQRALWYGRLCAEGDRDRACGIIKGREEWKDQAILKMTRVNDAAASTSCLTLPSALQTAGSPPSPLVRTCSWTV